MGKAEKALIRSALGLAALVAILAALVVVPFFLLGQAFEAEAAGWISARQGRVAAALVVVGLLAADIVLPVPSSIVGTAAGALLGWVGGSAAVFAGLTLSASLGFAAGRRWGPRIVLRFAGAEAQRLIEDWVARRGVIAIAATRAVPVLAEAMAVMAGAGRLRPVPFLLGAGAANLGLALAYAGAGAMSRGEAGPALAFAASVALPAMAWLAWRIAVAPTRTGGNKAAPDP